MKINYPTLAVLSLLVLFAGLIVVQPALAQEQEKASIVYNANLPEHRRVLKIPASIGVLPSSF